MFKAIVIAFAFLAHTGEHAAHAVQPAPVVAPIESESPSQLPTGPEEPTEDHPEPPSVHSSQSERPTPDEEQTCREVGQWACEETIGEAVTEKEELETNCESHARSGCEKEWEEQAEGARELPPAAPLPDAE